LPYGVKCRANCAWRTYGKYRRCKGNKIIINKSQRPIGTCVCVKIEISKDGRCNSFKDWDEWKKENQNAVSL